MAERRGKQLPIEEMQDSFPSLRSLLSAPGRASQEAWIAVFKAQPDAMHQLLADFIKQAYAKPGRIGQRPMPREGDVDLEALVYGEDNEVPIGEILPKLLGGGQRSQAQRVHMSRTQYQRLLAGEYHPDVKELRVIAKVVGKHPSFFVEYRKAMATAAFVSFLDENPGVATTIFRKYVESRLP